LRSLEEAAGLGRGWQGALRQMLERIAAAVLWRCPGVWSMLCSTACT